MDANQITIPISVNTSGVDTSMDQLKEKLASLTKELGKTSIGSKAFENISKEINATKSSLDKAKEAASGFEKEAGKTATLKKQYREATIEVQRIAEAYGITSIEAANAAKKAANLKDEIGDSAKLISTFDPDKKFVALQGALKGVVGAFEAVAGVQALFGSKSEELEQTLRKVQGAMAISKAIDDIFEAKEAFANLATQVKANETVQKLYNYVMTGSAKATALTTVATEVNTVATEAQEGATVAATVATNASSAAMKGFRLALISTGIGALVVGLGLLIANFDKVVGWIKQAIDWFKGLSGTVKNVISIIFPFIGIIRAIGSALESLGIIDTDAEAEMKENSRKMADSMLKRQESVGNYYDFEIRKAEAAGNDTYELERLKQQAILDTARAYVRSMKAIVDNGDATEEEIKRWNEQMKLIDETKKDMEVGRIAHDKKIADDKKKKDEDTKNKNKKAAEDSKKATENRYKQELEELKATYDEKVSIEKENTNQRFVLQTEAIDKEREFYDKHWKQLGLSEKEYNVKKKELAKARNEIIKNQKDFQIKVTDEITQLENTIDEGRLSKIRQIAEKRLAIESLSFDERKAIMDKEIADEKAVIDVLNKRDEDKIKKIKETAAIELENKNLTADEIKAINLRTETSTIEIQDKIDTRNKESADKQVANNEQIKISQMDLAKTSIALTLESIGFRESQLDKEDEFTKGHFDRLRSIENEYYNAKLDEENTRYEAEKAAAKGQKEKLEQIEREHALKMQEIQTGHTEAVITLKQKEKDAEWSKVQFYEEAGMALADAIGQQTAFGKSVAVAEAVISTYKAAAQVFAQPAPGIPPTSLAIKIASMVAALATGYKNVKSILSTKVPGRDTTASAPSLSSAGSAVPAAQTTFAAPQLFGIGGEQIKDVAKLKDQKIYVTEQDISRTQARVSQVRKASIQGG